jgi:CcmD family protein
MQYLEYMTAAYTIIWVAILLYFLNLGRKEREIWRDLQALKESLRQGQQ